MDMREELLRRQALWNQVEHSAHIRQAESTFCKRHVTRFINNWCWTYDPRAQQKHLPFVLYPFQEEFMHWLDERYENQEFGLIEKSRDMGVTWMITVWAVHKFIFQKGFGCLFGSRVEALVDDNSVDSIFGKLRYNLYRLPDFLRPRMHIPIRTGRRLVEADSRLNLVNPDNMNEITGQSTNKNFARGGRRSIVFLDEFAFVENSDSIWKAVSQNSNCIIPVSTPNGKGNHFYTLRQNKDIPSMALHWKDHPNKDDAWYERKKLEMEPHQLAQEIDIDYLASKAGRVYKRADRTKHVHNYIIYPNKHFEQFVTWDYGIADYMVMIFGQVLPEGDVEIYAEYKNTDQDIDFYLPITKGSRPPEQYWQMLPKSQQDEIDKLIVKVFHNPDNNEREWYEFTHYGDFAGTQRTANSRRSVKERMGYPPWNIDLQCTSNQNHANRIQCFDNLLKLRHNSNGELVPRFRVSKDCQYTIDCLFNYVWDKEDVNNPNIKPKHDEFSHGMSALEFFAINRFPVKKSKPSTCERIR